MKSHCKHNKIGMQKKCRSNLLIRFLMASPTLDGVVADVEINNGACLLVSEDVALSRLDVHNCSRRFAH
jgi:hypothetical protein